MPYLAASLKALMGFQSIRHGDNRTHLRDELGGGVTQGLQHGSGLSVEQGHPIGHLVVDFILRLQLCDGAKETFLYLTHSEDNNAHLHGTPSRRPS